VSTEPDIVDRLRGGVFGLNRIPLCEEAAAQIAALRAELEKAREDAELYKYIKSRMAKQWERFTLPNVRFSPKTCFEDQTLDAAIRAAISTDQAERKV